MEGANNGGMLYHERQVSNLCALHCINTLLQGPYFSEVELAAHASDLDQREWQMMMLPAAGGYVSHNVSLGGNFSIQVIQKALEVWDLQVIPLNSPVAEPAKMDPDLENAYIFHPQDHWYSVRKVNGEWYNFNSYCAAPERLSKSCLAVYLNYWKGPGQSIFVVRGNFPTVFPISSSEDSTGFGKWLSPEDAERINKSFNPEQQTPQGVVESEQHSNQFLSEERINNSCNSVQQAPQEAVVETQQHSSQFLSDEEDEMYSDDDDEDLNVALVASLMDSSPVVTNAEASLHPSDERSQVASSFGGDKENTP
ncbi:ataxin-3 homolog isoform X1 [Trifolium pratense]|uniref:ataxin-3 homolog isoform X1 n=2 Tax=Trifolium pratense TaxID=57577 RepID=UPI001E691308|nr:ataxin-3 homolog isoform X1 [Trifolium pratense]